MKKMTIVTMLLLVSVFCKCSIATIIVNPSNGHAYEEVGVRLSWHNARDAAVASTHMGEHGYLATITSQQEQDFLLNNFSIPLESGEAWLGASDAAQEGVWKWVVGPEAGQTFWRGGSKAVGGYPVAYANWRSNQPSNEGGVEDYMVWRRDDQMKWNDLSGNTLKSYFIEYSVPEPTTLSLLAIGALTMLRKRRP